MAQHSSGRQKRSLTQAEDIDSERKLTHVCGFFGLSFYVVWFVAEFSRFQEKVLAMQQ